MQTFEIRDPIHKRIPFTEEERVIIDHPFFQRLRFISQLSFLESFVYPGATHDRFAHSLGSMHVAKRLFGRCLASSAILNETITKEEKEALGQCLSMAGLMHDMGHGPFSHCSEGIFPLLKDLPLNSTWWKQIPDRQSKHEDYSVLLIQTLAEEGVLAKDFAQDVASLIHGDILPSPFFLDLEKKLPTLQRVMKTFISGIVDCDRMDYLLRDSYYCGVVYGNYDIDWMISSMGLAQHEGRLIRTMSENGVRAFEDMLLARYHMIDQVYYHKTKSGFAYYLEQAILHKEIELTIPTDPYAYADLQDGLVLQALLNAAKNPKNYWSYHLMHRIPAKRLLRLYPANKEDQKTISFLKDLCKEQKISYFMYEHSQMLSKNEEIEPNVFVEKTILQGKIYVPILEYSDLLQKYNEKVKFTDFYLLREDVEKFE